MSVSMAPADTATLRGSLRLAVGTLIALPTTMAFLALSVAVVLGRALIARPRLRLGREAKR